MARVPDPQMTPEGPRYEGRLLDHPDEPVVDQGLRFDVRTLFSRRQAFSFAGVGALAVGLAACATDDDSSSTTTTATTTADGEIPEETAGPYPGDGSNGPDVLEESGIVRSDITTSIDGSGEATGVAMTLTLNILDMLNDDAGMEGAAVYVWHCDAGGLYSMYSDGVTDQTWLRGVQVVDANGAVTFTSIFPACYTGRWPHIHFEVYPDVDSIDDSANAIATSQVALPEDICTTVYELDEYSGSTENLAQVTLDNDNVFGDDGGELQLATVSGSVDAGYSVSLDVYIDTSTEAGTGSTAPESGMQGGPGEGGPAGVGGTDAPEPPSGSGMPSAPPSDG